MRKRGREISMCGCLWSTPHQRPDLAHSTDMCPDWKSNRQPFGLQAGTQSTELHQLGLVSGLSHCPTKKPHTYCEAVTYPPLSQTLGTTNMFSVSVNLLILDILYNWNHTICGSLFPVSIMFSRSIHILVYISTSFLFVAE